MIAGLKKKIIGFLTQGISSQSLALTFTLGICLGTIPLLGATTLLCMLAALLFRLNMPAIQAINYITYPLQLLLYIPFLKAGAYLFCSTPFNYSLSEIVHMLKTNLWQTMSDFLFVNLAGLLLWFIISAVIFYPLYWVLLKVFLRIEVASRRDN